MQWLVGHVLWVVIKLPKPCSREENTRVVSACFDVGKPITHSLVTMLIASGVFAPPPKQYTKQVEKKEDPWYGS